MGEQDDDVDDGVEQSTADLCEAVEALYDDFLADVVVLGDLRYELRKPKIAAALVGFQEEDILLEILTQRVLRLPGPPLPVVEAVDALYEDFLVGVESREDLVREKRKPKVASVLVRMPDDDVLRAIARRQWRERRRVHVVPIAAVVPQAQEEAAPKRAPAEFVRVRHCDSCNTKNQGDAYSCKACGELFPASSGEDEAGDAEQSVERAEIVHVSKKRDPTRPKATRAGMRDAKADYYRVKSLQVVHEIARPGRPKQSPLAIIALLCAVGGLLSVFVIGPGAALPVLLGVLLGHVALKEIRVSDGKLLGAGSAYAALVIGYVCIGLGVLALFGVITVLAVSK